MRSITPWSRAGCFSRGFGCADQPTPLMAVTVPAAVLALGLAGLPLTGGALAKSAINAPLGDGLAGALSTLSAITSTLLIHFVHCLTRGAHPPSTRPSLERVICWLAIAFASLAVPWALYSAALGASPRAALAPGMLWEAFWPLLIGALGRRIGPPGAEATACTRR
jgi:multicomponent Na+:H+ antiporter subunit A